LNRNGLFSNLCGENTDAAGVKGLMLTNDAQTKNGGGT